MNFSVLGKISFQQIHICFVGKKLELISHVRPIFSFLFAISPSHICLIHYAIGKGKALILWRKSFRLSQLRARFECYQKLFGEEDRKVALFRSKFHIKLDNSVEREGEKKERGREKERIFNFWSLVHFRLDMRYRDKEKSFYYLFLSSEKNRNTEGNLLLFARSLPLPFGPNTKSRRRWE
jgi:hypothetical protein